MAEFNSPEYWAELQDRAPHNNRRPVTCGEPYDGELLPNLKGGCCREPDHGPGGHHYALMNISPDCRDGNCTKCDGVAWDLVADAPTDCECPHHTPVTSK
jgi:hypothetical protein